MTMTVSMGRRFCRASTMAVLLAWSAMAASTMVGTAKADGDSTPANNSAAVIRRLSPDQYRQIISDVFGPTIKIGGRFVSVMKRRGPKSVVSVSEYVLVV